MHPDPIRAQKRWSTPCCDQALASIAKPATSVSSEYVTSDIAVRAGPRGMARDTTANASMIAAASANHRCRRNRLIRLLFYGAKSGIPDCFRLQNVTLVTPLGGEGSAQPPRPLSAAPSPARIER